MTIDLTVLSGGAFFTLMALIWKVIASLTRALTIFKATSAICIIMYHVYFLLASKSEAKTGSETASKVAHKADDLTLLQSPEADLTVVDGLYAKLIALAPPAEQPH